MFVFLLNYNMCYQECISGVTYITEQHCYVLCVYFMYHFMYQYELAPRLNYSKLLEYETVTKLLYYVYVKHYDDV